MNDFVVDKDEPGLEIADKLSKTEFQDLGSVETLKIDSL